MKSCIEYMFDPVIYNRDNTEPLSGWYCHPADVCPTMHSGHCSGNTQSGKNQQFSNNLNVHCWVNNWSITGLFSMHSLELYTSSSKCCLKKSGCSKSKHEETSIHIANQYSFSVPPGAIDGGFACSVANIAPSSVPLWSNVEIPHILLPSPLQCFQELNAGVPTHYYNYAVTTAWTQPPCSVLSRTEQGIQFHIHFSLFPRCFQESDKRHNTLLLSLLPQYFQCILELINLLCL